MNSVDMRKYKRDIEETDLILDSYEGDPVNFWEEKQKELVTSVVDYNLGTLADLVVEENIDISPKYQRRFRWDDTKKSRLIESFLMNVPVPPVFLNEDAYGKYSVIDGKQRLTAITEFLRGRLRLKNLEVFSDINGLTFDELPPALRNVVRTRPTLRAVIILRQSDPDVKFEVFKRLNTGGVTLNPQEIRNSTYPGPLNDLILDLSEDKLFHRLLGIKKKQYSAIYQEMRDAELVLRFFTFRKTWETFRGGMKRHMDRFIAENQYMEKAKLEELKEDFLKTIKVVSACFGEYAFRRWIPERGFWRQQVLAALFDAQMFACRGRDPETFALKHHEIIEEFKKLFEDSNFRRSIDAATNAPGSFRSRIHITSQLLDKMLGR